MKVYVEYSGGGDYRVSLKPRSIRNTKEFDIPETAAYLLLAAQASTDALQDSLEAMWNRNGDDRLRWEDEGGAVR